LRWTLGGAQQRLGLRAALRDRDAVRSTGRVVVDVHQPELGIKSKTALPQGLRDPDGLVSFPIVAPQKRTTVLF
jgi:hypothetical protein